MKKLELRIQLTIVTLRHLCCLGSEIHPEESTRITILFAPLCLRETTLQNIRPVVLLSFPPRLCVSARESSSSVLHLREAPLHSVNAFGAGLGANDVLRILAGERETIERQGGVAPDDT